MTVVMAVMVMIAVVIVVDIEVVLLLVCIVNSVVVVAVIGLNKTHLTVDAFSSIHLTTIVAVIIVGLIVIFI